jgi:two-component system LytT family sensor kinase
MNLYNFIFSEKRSHQLQRHLIFWLLWWLYFTISYFHYEQTGLNNNVEFEPWKLPFFIKTTLLLCVHIISCYIFINWLMPKYLFKEKYAALVTGIFILGLFILFSSYFMHKTILPVINTAFDHNPVIENPNIWWTSITSGLLSAPKVTTAAAAIKLLKRWWLKQKEKERLEKEKLLTDLQLLKAQMHPEFLFSSLKNIYELADKKENNKSANLLLKLADILSYILYESENEKVPIKKEISVIKDYLVIEKIRLGNKLELDVAVKGDPGKKLIIPLLLFSVIENIFSQIDEKSSETTWLNLEIQIEETCITMKIIYGQTNEPLLEGMVQNKMAKLIKQLDFYYPGNYELKTTIEPDMMMISLTLIMEESFNEKPNAFYTTEQIVYATV